MTNPPPGRWATIRVLPMRSLPGRPGSSTSWASAGCQPPRSASFTTRSCLTARGFGLANPDTGTPATAETIYSICSISKLFTSVAFMQLRDEGRVRLDAPVSEYLDWFTLQDAHPNDEAITVRRLLSHSSGLPRESDFPYWSDPDFVFPTHDQIVQQLSNQSTLYPSSRYFQYSNLGLTLVGEIVANVSGQDYHERSADRDSRPPGDERHFHRHPRG